MTFIDGAAPPASELVKDGTDQGFMADVVEQSRETPVIVDFWALWCGPCRTLGPMLEKAVHGAGGKVRMVKINIDENPGVAGQLGVKSIPAVYAFDQGRPIDGFMGAIPESQIKLFVERLSGADMTAEIEPLLEMAAESLKLNDIGGAAQAYTAVLQLDQTNIKAIAGMARLAVSTGDIADAEEIPLADAARKGQRPPNPRRPRGDELRRRGRGRATTMNSAPKSRCRQSERPPSAPITPKRLRRAAILKAPAISCSPSSRKPRVRTRARRARSF